jgi:hypothetical protein
MTLRDLVTLPEAELHALMNKVGHLSNEEQRKVMGYAPCTCTICKEYRIKKMKEAQSMLNKIRSLDDWDEVLVP